MSRLRGRSQCPAVGSRAWFTLAQAAAHPRRDARDSYGRHDTRNDICLTKRDRLGSHTKLGEVVSICYRDGSSASSLRGLGQGQRPGARGRMPSVPWRGQNLAWHGGSQHDRLRTYEPTTLTPSCLHDSSDNCSGRSGQCSRRACSTSGQSPSVSPGIPARHAHRFRSAPARGRRDRVHGGRGVHSRGARR
jgi:hypothetical protein